MFIPILLFYLQNFPTALCSLDINDFKQSYIHNINYVTGACADCGKIVSIKFDGSPHAHKRRGNYINYIACKRRDKKCGVCKLCSSIRGEI